MNKKELIEIKKQLTPVNCNITRIASCLVTQEKECIPQKPEAFLSLPEEETFKYFDLYKKALSGTIGKNLFTVPFPRDDHSEKQLYMEKLRKSRLEDDNILYDFYEKVAETYGCTEKYLIILIHGMYDIPGKTTDNQEMFDASEEVYEYIHCILCPVTLSKAGLTYNREENSVMDRIRDHVVEMPLDGILYPAFNDRGPDVNAVLYYSKKTAATQEDFLEELLGNQRSESEDEKKVWLGNVLESVGEHGAISLSQMQGIYDQYHSLVEEDYQGDSTISPAGFQTIAERAGLSAEQSGEIRNRFERDLGKEASLSGFLDTNAFCVKTPSLTIKAVPERAGDLEVRILDGRPMLVIPLDTTEAEVNGIGTRLVKKK